MTKTDATAEVFWTAFRSLSQKERQAVINRMLEDKNLRHDLQDMAVIRQRKTEPERPLRQYLESAR